MRFRPIWGVIRFCKRGTKNGTVQPPRLYQKSDRSWACVEMFFIIPERMLRTGNTQVKPRKIGGYLRQTPVKNEEKTFFRLKFGKRLTGLTVKKRVCWTLRNFSVLRKNSRNGLSLSCLKSGNRNAKDGVSKKFLDRPKFRSSSGFGAKNSPGMDFE